MDRVFSKKANCIIATLLCMFLWGSLFPCIKIGYQNFAVDTSSVPSILLFAGVRFIICGIIIIIIASVKDKKIVAVEKGSIVPILLIGLFSIVLHYSLQYIGLSSTGGGKCAMLKQVGSIIVACFGFLFDKNDKFSIKKLLGGVLGFASVVILNLDSNGFSISIPEVLVLLSSFCMVASSAVSKKVYKKYDPVAITGYTQLTGGIILFAFGIVSGGKIAYLGIKSIAILAYICFASVISYILWNVLIKYCDLSMLFCIRFTEPVFAALISFFIVKEDIFKWTFAAALVLVSAGMIISNLKVKQK